MSGTEGHAPLESDLLRQRIRLYIYGELALTERLEVERCLDEDPAFRALFEDEKAFLGSLGGPEPDTDVDALLTECRGRLDRAIAREPRTAGRRPMVSRVLSGLRDFANVLSGRPLAWQPVTAVLLVATGFAIGRGLERAPVQTAERAPGVFPVQSISTVAAPPLAGVEAVRLDPASGQVQIVVEERRVLSGDSSDPVIRGMLLATVQGAHTGARLTSLDALRGHASEHDIRAALLRTMREDDDVGVRLKALEAVQAQARHPDVRAALVEMLQRDPNPGMRAHAIEILREHADRDMAGPLQELVERESNAYVLQETERILESLGASMERY